MRAVVCWVLALCLVGLFGADDVRGEETSRGVLVCFAGDCTLGFDENFGYYNSLAERYDTDGDLGWFFGGVASVFRRADFVAANLETTLTEAVVKQDKEFRFKGYPALAGALVIGGVGAVNLANNHTYDYLERGFRDTVDNLEDAGVGYFGLGYGYVADVNGVKLGFLGYKGWSAGADVKKAVTRDIEGLRGDGADLVFVYFHWGVEGENFPEGTQTTLGRHAIDSGADLVWASHPHVIQGIERYSGKYIVYSLGNFCYGGHKNPADKDTFILAYSAVFGADGSFDSRVEIIPCMISSVKTRNDYRPTVAKGADFERVKARLIEYSEPLGCVLTDDMFVRTPAKPVGKRDDAGLPMAGPLKPRGYTLENLR